MIATEIFLNVGNVQSSIPDDAIELDFSALLVNPALTLDAVRASAGLLHFQSLVVELLVCPLPLGIHVCQMLYGRWGIVNHECSLQAGVVSRTIFRWMSQSPPMFHIQLPQLFSFLIEFTSFTGISYKAFSLIAFSIWLLEAAGPASVRILRIILLKGNCGNHTNLFHLQYDNHEFDNNHKG